MLVEYLFVYSEKNGTFPVRLRIVELGDESELTDAAQLTGSIEKSDVTETMDRLRQEYPSPEFRVAKSWANTWQAVARNYAGLDYDHFSSSPPKNVDTTPPGSTGTQPLGAILMETTGSKGTHVYNFAGVVLFLGAAAVSWPEFSQRYGGMVSWFWTFIRNPQWGIYGIILPLCIAAGAYALYWLVYYWRVRVVVHQCGIRFLPNGRFVNWNDVEHIQYAFRSMRFAGTPRHALRLEVRGSRPVNLPHKFDGMERLVTLVRTHVEPVVLRKVKDRLHEVGRASFGKHITITSEYLALNVIGVSVSLAEVGRVVIVGGTFQVTNADGRVFFSKSVESIPDATVISGLVAALKRPAERQAT